MLQMQKVLVYESKHIKPLCQLGIRRAKRSLKRTQGWANKLETGDDNSDKSQRKTTNIP